MALRFDWAQISNEYVQNATRDMLNAIITEKVMPNMMGGFMYIENLCFGQEPPLIAFSALNELSDDIADGTVSLRYASNASISIRVYAPINELYSKKGKIGRRARGHFCSYDSVSLAYMPIKAYLGDLQIDTDINVRVDQLSRMATVTLSSFPLQSFKLSTSFDGSVLMVKMIEAIEGKIRDTKAELSKTNYTFTIPLPESETETEEIESEKQNKRGKNTSGQWSDYEKEEDEFLSLSQHISMSPIPRRTTKVPHQEQRWR